MVDYVNVMFEVIGGRIGDEEDEEDEEEEEEEEEEEDAKDEGEYEEEEEYEEDEEYEEEVLEFELKDLDGEKVSLKKLKGKKVVVCFWATWCPYCSEELVDIEALYQNTEDDDLVILKH